MHASSVISDAEAAVSRAKAAGGDKLAMYDTVIADLYLEKAREEQGHARYGDAARLAAKAVEHAGAAERKATDRRNAEQPSSMPPPASAPRATIQRQEPVPPPAQAPGKRP